MLGQEYYLIIGPIVFVLTLAVWLFLVYRASAQRDRTPDEHSPYGDPYVELYRANPVRGGIIEGSPAQVNSDREAPVNAPRAQPRSGEGEQRPDQGPEQSAEQGAEQGRGPDERSHGASTQRQPPGAPGGEKE